MSVMQYAYMYMTEKNAFVIFFSYDGWFSQFFWLFQDIIFFQLHKEV